MGQQIHWFPGHMNKALNEVEKKVKLVDVIIELFDARAPMSSINENLEKITQDKKRLIVLTKTDLADPEQTKKWMNELAKTYDDILSLDLKSSNAESLLSKAVISLGKNKWAKEMAKGMKPQPIRTMIIGIPNVGKSSLTNAILNQDRVIVSNSSGTTRDSIDTPFNRNGKNYLVIDTAGLKKRGKIYESIDKYSAIRALKAIERSEIVLLVLDGKEGITEQDKHVIQYATDLHKAIIIVVNKWDLVDKQTNTMSDYVKIIREEYKFLDYAPVVFVSALKKQRLDTLFETLDSVHQAYYTRIKTSLLNEVMQDAQVMNQAPNFNGGRLKILYASQVSSAPPTIVLFVNDPNFMHFSYQRYIENRLRDTFNFDGTPIRIVLKKRTNQSK